MKEKLAKMSSLQRPNLLVNADFRSGAINQGGKTSYAVAPHVYTIDMWKMGSDNQTLTINNGYIRVTKNTSGTHCLINQHVELNSNIAKSSNFTLTLRIRASTKAKYHLYSTNKYFDIDTTWKTVVIHFNGAEIDMDSLRSDNFVCWMGCVSYNNPTLDKLPSGFWFDVEFIKLEYGTEFTGMPVYNNVLELTKCYRRYLNFHNNRLTLPQAWIEQYGGFLFPVEMVRTPTCSGSHNGIDVGFEATTKGVSVVWGDKVKPLPPALLIGNFIADANYY